MQRARGKNVRRTKASDDCRMNCIDCSTKESRILERVPGVEPQKNSIFVNSSGNRKTSEQSETRVQKPSAHSEKTKETDARTCCHCRTRQRAEWELSGRRRPAESRCRLLLRRHPDTREERGRCCFLLFFLFLLPGGGRTSGGLWDGV